MKSFLGAEDVEGMDKLQRFPAGQGFPIRSYLGGKEVALQSLKRLPPAEPASGVPEHDPATHTKSKLLDAAKWDATQTLFKSGGHMSSIGYFGNTSGRTGEELVRREAGAVQRGRQAHERALERPHCLRGALQPIRISAMSR